MIQIGPSFLSFITLLVTAIVVTLIFRVAARQRLGNGSSDLIAEFIVAYTGAWLSRFLIGTGWFLTVNGVSLIPAILGSAALLLLATRFATAVRGLKAASQN